MKIEIGESLAYSWLRHVKKCQIVQTNWKPSKQWTRQNVDYSSLVSEIQTKFIAYDLDIFKQNKMGQFFQQAEIDALGISYKPQNDFVNFVDVAFHEAGLNYGSAPQTIARVIKKFVRSFFVYQEYFPKSTHAEFFFISPIIAKETLYFPLKNVINDLETIFKAKGYHPKFIIIANEDFNAQILNPILDLTNDIADTNELFVRSIQLYGLFNKKQKPSPTLPIISKKLIAAPTITLNPPAFPKKKIGQHVQDSVDYLLKMNMISKGEVVLLLEKHYSKITFNINLSFLRRIKDGRNDKNGNPRYYKDSLIINGDPYYLCSQWIEKDRSNFDNWVSRISERQVRNLQ